MATRNHPHPHRIIHSATFQLLFFLTLTNLPLILTLTLTLVSGQPLEDAKWYTCVADSYLLGTLLEETLHAAVCTVSFATLSLTLPFHAPQGQPGDWRHLAECGATHAEVLQGFLERGGVLR